jgi:hypothetical protein
MYEIDHASDQHLSWKTCCDVAVGGDAELLDDLHVPLYCSSRGERNETAVTQYVTHVQ